MAYQEGKNTLQKIVKENLPSLGRIENDYFLLTAYTPSYLAGNRLLSLKESLKKFPVYLVLSSLDSYQGEEKKNREKGEILLSRNDESLPFPETLWLAQKEYRVIPIDNSIPGNIATSAYGIYFSDEKELQSVIPYYSFPYKGDVAEPIIEVEYRYDLPGINEEGYLAHMKNIYHIDSQSAYRLSMYELNGGFVFLGAMITILFLVGTILVMYYKQISEAYEDRRTYHIMQNIGLDDEMIQKACNKQILFVFFLPLIVAILHSFVASRIVYKMLLLFGAKNYFDYLPSLSAVIILFAGIYYLLFKLTSRVYYHSIH